MALLSKLFSLASLGGTFANVTLLHHFFSGITSVLALTIVTSLLSAFVIVGIYIAIYFGLVAYGLAPLAAGITVLVLVAIMMTALITATIYKIRNLRALPYQHSAHREIPGFSQISDMAEAFMDGLLKSGPRRRR